MRSFVASFIVAVLLLSGPGVARADDEALAKLAARLGELEVMRGNRPFTAEDLKTHGSIVFGSKSKPKFTDDDIALLSAMPKLYSLDLASLPKLSSVTVRKTAFTPAGDEKLKQTNAKVRISR